MKKGKSRSLIGIILALLLAFTMAFAVGCGGGELSEAEKEQSFVEEMGGTSETYEGEVSSVAYASEQNAAQAFVEEEIVGENDDVNIVSTVVKATYEGEAIADLNLPESIKASASIIKEVEVSYNSTSGASGFSTAYSGNKVIKVYVVKIGTDWKYFAPMPETSATITKSYYNSVFNADNYLNCTFKTTSVSTSSATASVPGYGTMTNDATISISQFVKFDLANDKLYLEIVVTLEESIMGETDTYTNIMKLYLNGDECYMYHDNSDYEFDGVWSEAEFANSGYDLEELAPFYSGYLDHTYFTKTESGFEISSDKMEEYVQKSVFTSMMDEGFPLEYIENMGVDMVAKYYVKEGILSGMRVDGEINMRMDLEYAGMPGVISDTYVTAKAESICYDYGTTVVSDPRI